MIMDQVATGNRQVATGRWQQAGGNRQQAGGNLQHALASCHLQLRLPPALAFATCPCQLNNEP